MALKNSFRYPNLLNLPARFRTDPDSRQTVTQWIHNWIAQPEDLASVGNVWTWGIPAMDTSELEWDNLVNMFMDLLSDPLMITGDIWTGSFSFNSEGIDKSLTFSYLQDGDQNWYFEIIESSPYTTQNFGEGIMDRRVQFAAPDRDREFIS